MAANIEQANGIDRTRSRFEEWRKTRSRKTPIPDELWSMAINVARREGVNPTAQQLHLDAGKLKRLLVAADSRQRNRERQPGFLELTAPAPVAAPCCVIEFETASGSKMRIHWKTDAPPDWTGLLRCWRDTER
jgi:hypothetical protein